MEQAKAAPMRFTFILLAFVATALAGFAQSATNTAPKAIVGTWQWVGVDQRAIPNLFYIRFYSDGTTATWPAPAGPHTTNGVLHAGYRFDGANLVIATNLDRIDPKSKVEIKGDQMEIAMVNCGETNRYSYRRVIPDLEPGKLMAGQTGR